MPSRFKASAMGWVLQCSCGIPQTLTRAANKRALSAFFSSAGDGAMAADAVPVVPLIVLELDCDC